MVITGLFSDQYAEAPWSLARVKDLLRHMWVPMVIMGLGGMAGLIRVIRANLLDELNKPYVMTARAKGLARVEPDHEVSGAPGAQPVCQHPWFQLPGLVSGGVILSLGVGPAHRRRPVAVVLALARYVSWPAPTSYSSAP